MVQTESKVFFGRKTVSPVPQPVKLIASVKHLCKAFTRNRVTRKVFHVGRYAQAILGLKFSNIFCEKAQVNYVFRPNSLLKHLSVVLKIENRKPVERTINLCTRRTKQMYIFANLLRHNLSRCSNFP